jgi:hypothetical protein
MIDAYCGYKVETRVVEGDTSETRLHLEIESLGRSDHGWGGIASGTGGEIVAQQR